MITALLVIAYGAIAYGALVMRREIVALRLRVDCAANQVTAYRSLYEAALERAREAEGEAVALRTVTQSLVFGPLQRGARRGLRHAVEALIPPDVDVQQALNELLEQLRHEANEAAEAAREEQS